MDEKKCTKCGEIKPIDRFRKRTKGNSYQSWCKNCDTKYQRNDAPGRFWTHLVHNINRWNTEDRIKSAELKAIDREHCYLCGEKLDGEIELDHINPLSRGGKTRIGNLAWTHRQCNRLKHDMTIDEMKKKMEKILANLK